MSIKSDNWIRRMCTPPDGVVTTPNGAHYFLQKKGERWFYREHGLEFDSPESFNFHIYTPEEKTAYKPMIEPFAFEQVKHREHWSNAAGVPLITHTEKIVSHGTSSYGYDVRCADEFKIFTNVNSAIVDPKNFDEKSFVDFKGDVCIIPPNSFALARTVEYFRIPRNILTICLGKSTYARCGIIVNVTPLEPEWEGYVTLEFSNTTPLPAKIYANEGVAQLLFFQADETCETSYADRGGKYMGQEARPVPPKV